MNLGPCLRFVSLGEVLSDGPLRSTNAAETGLDDTSAMGHTVGPQIIG